MSEERFELTINSNGQADIIDKVESKEKNAICIYNDLGVPPYSSAKAVCDLLNEQDAKITEQAIQIDFLRDENKHMRQVLEENRQLKQFKELLCAVLKQEYEDRTNEMNRWAEKEDWNGYRATKLEYGTVIRIAKRIGVDLDN